METDIRWIKVSTGLFSDDKMRLIRAMKDGDEMVIIWLQLLLLAGRVNQDGFLALNGNHVPYREEDMAVMFEVDPETLHRALEVFEGFGMVELLEETYHITNWGKHQAVDGMERIREQNRKRIQRFRAKKLQKPEKPEPKETEKDTRFARFWAAYPKKVGKGAAEKAFGKIRPSDALTEKMIRAVEDAKMSAQWRREGGQYIPNPATWLNQKRWEDELTEAPPPQSSRRLENWDE